MSKEEIAEDIIKKHLDTINWDEGCMETLKANILIGLDNYAQQQVTKLNIDDVRLSFDELKDKILKHKAKSEYKQASIIILRNIFEENEA